MNLETLTSLEGDNLRKSWNNLVDLSGNSVFSRYPFVRNVEKYYGDLMKLNILLAYENGDLVGIAPFAEENGEIKFATGLDYKAIADYNDLIIHPNFREQVISLFFDEIKDRGFVLRDIPQSSPNKPLITFDNEISQSEEPSSFVPLPNNWEEYYSQLRKNDQRAIRVFWEKFPQAKLKIVDQIEEVSEYFQHFVNLHQERCQAKGLPGCFANDERHQKFKEYHQSLSRDLSEEGNLNMVFILEGNRPIASKYGFKDKDTFYYYLGGFDSEFNKYSISKVLGFATIKNLIENGFKKFDFLRGYEEYKNDFLVQWTQNQDIKSKR